MSVENLDGMIDCKDLILCDAFVAKKSLNNFERKPVSMIELPFEDLFDQRRGSNRKLNRTYLSFDKLYRETIESGFEISPDNFSGFGLFNKTAKIIKPRINPLPFPLGIVDNIPGNMRSEISDLSIMKGTLFDSEKVLLGTVRFVNHSCSPNARYYQGFSWELPYPCVRQQVVRSIYPEEEITVSYGESFFGSNNRDCLCPFREFHGDSEHEESPQIADGVPEVLSDNQINTPLNSHNSRNSLDISQTPVGNPILSGSSTSTGSKTRTATLQRKRHLKLTDSSTCPGKKMIQSFIDKALDSPESLETPRVEHFTCEEDENSQLRETNEESGEFSSFFPLQEVSALPDCSSSEVYSSRRSSDRSNSPNFLCEQSISPAVPCQSSSFDFGTEMLNENVSVQNAMLSLMSIVFGHAGSDDLLNDLLMREKALNPSSFYPSPNLVRSKISKCTEMYLSESKYLTGGELILLNFAEYLAEIVRKNINSIFQYSRVEARTQRDIKLKPLCDGEKLRIRLILNTDGAKVRKSSSRSAYPVWIGIADLPPILRSSFRNILLCSIW